MSTPSPDYTIRNNGPCEHGTRAGILQHKIELEKPCGAFLNAETDDLHVTVLVLAG